MQKRILSTLILSFTMIACSVYQSDGREYLEKNAFQLANSTAQAHLLGCRYGHTNENSWIVIQETNAARVLASENDEFQMRVMPKASAADYHCDYRFNSAQELYEKSASAIELTLLHFGLGEFAFRPMTHLK